MPSSYAIGKHYEAFIKRLVESGRYASASEVVRAALRKFEADTAVPDFTVEELRQSLADVRKANSYSDVDGLMQELEGIVAKAETAARNAA